MSRPETIHDVKVTHNTIATVEMDRLYLNSDLLAAYTTFLKKVEAHNGTATNRWGSSIELKLPKTTEDLESQLRVDQMSWDNHQEYYEQLLRGEEFEHNYKRDLAISHAKDEGLPLPADEDANA